MIEKGIREPVFTRVSKYVLRNWWQISEYSPNFCAVVERLPAPGYRLRAAVAWNR